MTIDLCKLAEAALADDKRCTEAAGGHTPGKGLKPLADTPILPFKAPDAGEDGPLWSSRARDWLVQLHTYLQTPSAFVDINSNADAAFIAAARTREPLLAAEVLRLSAENVQLKREVSDLRSAVIQVADAADTRRDVLIDIRAMRAIANELGRPFSPELVDARVREFRNRLVSERDQLHVAIKYLRSKIDGYDETFEHACTLAGIDPNIL